MFSKALLSFHWIRRWSQSFHGWGHDIQSARPACCPTRSPRNSLKKKKVNNLHRQDLCSFCHLVGQLTRNREQDHTSLLAVSDGERMALYVGAFLPVICNLIVSVIVVTITILVFVPSMDQPWQESQTKSPLQDFQDEQWPLCSSCPTPGSDRVVGDSGSTTVVDNSLKWLTIHEQNCCKKSRKTTFSAC